MFLLMLLFLCRLFPELGASSNEVDFAFDGFLGANLSMDGTATITPEGLLRLTNTTKLLKGHAFYPPKVRFKSPPDGGVLSFSSTFVFGIVSGNRDLSGHGIVLALTPTKDLGGATATQYMGILSTSNNGNSSNHIVGVEVDTIQNPELGDINANHVGIDINSLRSVASNPAGYFSDNDDGQFKNLSLLSGEPMQLWLDYDGEKMQLNVTLAPMGVAKPRIPLLSATIDLSAIIFAEMYVGFSSSSDPFQTSHYILGWSFRVNGQARALNLSKLPPLPKITIGKKSSKSWTPWLSSASAVIFLGAVAVIVLIMRRRIKFSELVEEWELQYGSQRFSFKDLYKATNGFGEEELLGAGGFGKVYRGVLPSSKLEIAVKRVSHDSRQGMKEFIAEIVSIGRLRHRNLVQLLGYCRRKGELLLVYDFMPNGSLDKRLFYQGGEAVLSWNQRFRIIKGVASGLLYLHEEWEQVVVHRDVKASNVLLDGDLNGRLGDFGLARLYDRGSSMKTTHLVGTTGYIAPELAKAGKANTVTDVFAFGVFLLEVACGRRPIEPSAPEEEVVLLDMVLASWTRGAIWDAGDPTLLGEYPAEEMELVLKLGLLCCDPLPAARPSMRRVMQMLERDVPLPEFSSNYLNSNMLALLHNEALHEQWASFPSASISVSLLSGGR
ncbi:hypothetical protein Taro_002760 [Colocasia esculenta]|uniref:non-specific serine/threonine protein kinase n=1 Tax=Colocasia esculenta TaxID=4460 RepID=A0A843TLU0_COLES|nr:hypothetical protein [Colocasia esculenta]